MTADARARGRGTGLRLERAGWLAAGACALILGWLVVSHTIEVIGLFLLPALSIIRRPEGRVAVFVFGCMLTLGSAGPIAEAKPFYLAFVSVTAVYSVHLITRTEAFESRTTRFALTGAGVVAGSVVLAAVRGLASGAAPALVVRDGFTYWLIVCGIAVGIEIGHSVSRRFIVVLAVLTCSFGAVSFAVHYLNARGVTALAIDQLGLPSMMLLAFGVPFALVQGAGRSRVRPLWLFWGLLLIGCILVTGSRSGLVLFTAFIGVIGSQVSGGVSVRRTAVIGVIGLAILFVGAKPVVDAVTTPGFYESRVVATQRVMTSGVGADGSGVMRERALSIALGEWRKSELVGVGFGHEFASPAADAGPVLFQIDTPSLYLAKFGLVGTALLWLGVGLVVGPLMWRRVGDRRASGEVTHVVRGAICVWTAATAFGAITEDKGFALGLMLIVMLEANREGPQGSVDDDRRACTTGREEERDALRARGFSSRRGGRF